MKTVKLVAISLLAFVVPCGCASRRHVERDVAVVQADSLRGEWEMCDSLDVHISELVVDFAECTPTSCPHGDGRRVAVPKRVALRRVSAEKVAKGNGAAQVAVRRSEVEQSSENRAVESAGWLTGVIVAVAVIFLTVVLLLKFIGHGKQ